MTNKERLQKIKQAVSLLREVEFSYEEGTHVRQMIYAIMVERFSITHIGALQTNLQEQVWKEDGII